MGLRWDEDEGYVVDDSPPEDGGIGELAIQAVEYLNKNYPESPITEFVDDLAYNAITSFHTPHRDAVKSSYWDLFKNVIGVGENPPETYAGSPMVEKYVKPHLIDMEKSEYKPSSYTGNVENWFDFPRTSNIDEWQYQGAVGDSTAQLKEGHSWDYYIPEVEEFPELGPLKHRWHTGASKTPGPLSFYMWGYEPGEDLREVRDKDRDELPISTEHLQNLVEQAYHSTGIDRYQDFKQYYQEILQKRMYVL